MVSNLPGSSSGLASSARHPHRRDKAKVESADNVSLLPAPPDELSPLLGYARSDRFERRAESPEESPVSSPARPSSPESPGSDDDDAALEKFLKEIYAEQARQLAMSKKRSLSNRRPALIRTPAYSNLRDALPVTFPTFEESAREEFSALAFQADANTKDVHHTQGSSDKDQGGFDIKAPVPRRPPGLNTHRPRANAFSALDSPQRESLLASGAGTSPRRHRRSHFTQQDPQSPVQEFRSKLARQFARVNLLAPIKPASHAELMEIFQIPYQYVLLGQESIHPFLSPNEAGNVLKTAKAIAVGDMHASFHKLMETLVTADMVEMPPMAARKFVLLANMVNKNDLELDKLARACQDLRQVISTMRWKGGDRQLILIGDMLSDRGPLDTVTLEIVKHLSQQAPDSFVRIASNHDHNALGYLLTEQHGIIPEQATSMLNAFQLAISTNSVAELGDSYFDYLEQSRLMHFDPVSKTLFSHAPISMAQLRKLSPLLPKDTPKPDEIETPEDVGRFVDAANRFYASYVRQNRRVAQELIRQNKSGIPQDQQKEVDLANRRKHVEPRLVNDDGFLWARNRLAQKDEAPFQKAGVKTLVHGHDMQSILGSPFSLFKQSEKEPDFTVVCLDQNVRKGAGTPMPEAVNSLFVQP